MDWNNLRSWLSGSSRDNELSSTKQGWERVEAAWRASPFASNNMAEMELAFLRKIANYLDPIPASHILMALSYAYGNSLEGEDVGPIEVTWPVVWQHVDSAVYLRQIMARRSLWVTETDRMLRIVTDRFLEAYTALHRRLPPACFDDWETDEGAFNVPLIELVEDPAELIDDLIRALYSDETLQLNLLRRVRNSIEANLLTASGLPPDTNPATVQHKLVMPSMQKGLSPSELVSLYLTNTPFHMVMTIGVPFRIPEEARFEHAEIIGGTGQGKTQLLQRMVYGDLISAKADRCSVIVIDSQGDLINKIVRLALFDPDQPDSLADRLVLIDPNDVEHPASLNLFDAPKGRLQRYGPADKERVLNGVVELYEGFFGDLLGAELTQKQGVIFKYLARLMLTIPEANIHTLMQLMENGEKFRPYMRELDGSARYFFAKEFFHPSFSATKKQILKRLWGVLATPAFERMFAQKDNKLDLFQAMQDGKIILISTAKDLLKTDASALFGRFFMALLKQAALERSTLPEDGRTPTFVYVDEAQEYFDDNTETLLVQARKQKVGIAAFHQTLDQASPRLRSTLQSNTSLKCVGGVSAKDARSLADELHTTTDFIESMKRRKGRTEFAAWLKHHTPTAIRLSVPLGFLEQQPILTEEAYAALIAANRDRYCGTLADVSGFDFEDELDTPLPPLRPRVQATPPPPSTPTVDPEDLEKPAPRPEPPLRAPPRAAEDRELGKGGPQHRYLQHVVQNLAQERGFRAVIEEAIGDGQLDVALYRQGVAIACEISVSSTPHYEAQNIAKCLRGSFNRVFAIAADTKRLKAIQATAAERLSADQLSSVDFLTPDQLPAALDALALPPEQENVVKGYRVKVSRTIVSPEEAKERRAAIARIMGKSLKGLDEGD